MKHLFLLAALVAGGSVSTAQDFYDPAVLRTVKLDFADPDWWNLLRANFSSQAEIAADLTVEGVLYPGVGVRIRGNTSYLALPAGSQKVSLNIKVDFTVPDQEIMGHDSLNFNNAFIDPTFCREVVFSNLAAQWIPNGRANHIVLEIGGANWGVYANVQQYGKRMLRQYYDDEDGMRVKCANNPNGPGLQYMGTNPLNYSQYEIKNDGGLADPVAEIIAVCNAVDNTSPANWATADQVFAIDPSIWTMVIENLFSDDDSYVNKGCDFVMYRNPVDGRMVLHQTDANETWTEDSWSADHNFSSSNKPFLSNTLSNTLLRGRYFAHLRTVLTQLDWATLEAQFIGHRDLIDAAVFNDPKKLYSYTSFVDNFKTTVTLPGIFSGPRVGLREYVDNRRALLLADPEVAAVPPTIQGVAVSTDEPGMPVYITATVTATDPIQSVRAYYRPTPESRFRSILMKDDGLSGDGAAGDGVFGRLLPIVGVGGEEILYYVGAVALNTFRAQSFMPERTEMAPMVLRFQFGTAPSDVVINEFLASNNVTIQDPAGDFEDYIELYNKGTLTVDISNHYLSDDLTNPTKWQFAPGTMIAPGATLLVWADDDEIEGPLHTNFKLSAGGEEIGFFLPDGGTVLDSLVFGNQESDISTGLLNDGVALRVTLPVPTPDALNDAGCGFRDYNRLDPAGHTLGLTVAGSASIGNSMVFSTAGMMPGAAIYFAAGLEPRYDVLMANNLVGLMNGSVFYIGTADASGAGASTTINLANLVGLIGLDVYIQAAGVDALGSFAASNAIHLTICP